MKNKKILRILSFILLLATVASLAMSCKDKTPEEPVQEPDPNMYDLTGFKIVRDAASDSNVAQATADIKRSIKDILGLDVVVSLDVDTDVGAKEILVGNTNRAESESTLAYLEKTYEENSYAIRIGSDKIVIVGTDDNATERAIYEFINTYVKASQSGNSLNIAAGAQIVAPYDQKNIITTSSGVEIHVDIAKQMYNHGATLMTDKHGNKMVLNNASYPSVTELRYQSDPKNNGKLIATMSLNVDYIYTATEPGGGTVMMSSDRGKTWEMLSRPWETKYPKLGSVGSMAHVYELPAQVGDMPAGTLLYAYNAVNYDNPDGLKGQSILAVWRSYDCGVNWEEYVIIDEAKGIRNGIWEPFMIYCEEDGYLYCFYSDDSDPDHDQKISYKRSKDGVNWEGEDGKIGTGTGKDVEPVDVVAIDKFKYRPGMPVITKMGNGEYFLVYEQFGDWTGCPIYYRKTRDLSDWGDANDIGTLIKAKTGEVLSSSPACIWLDVGGECGTLIVTAKSGSNKGFMLVSFDYGETWERIDNPLTGQPIVTDGSGNDRVGYSPAFWLSTDGKTIYYLSSINDAKNPTDTRVMGVARLTIYAPKSYESKTEE